MRARFSALNLLGPLPPRWRRGWSHTDSGDLVVLTPSSSGEEIRLEMIEESPVAVCLPELDSVITQIEVLPAWHKTAEIQHNANRSRQVGALGSLAWSRLSQARVGVVGVGGLGSTFAASLAQEGYGSLVLVDPDRLEPSDFTRWPFPMNMSEFGEFKVEALKTRLRTVNPEIQIDTIPLTVQNWIAFRQLIDCDFIVACCDSAIARRYVAQLGARYLVPIVSIGTGVFGTLEEPFIGWEGAMVLPGDRCLACMLRLDRQAAAQADQEREFGVGRLGSLRSINLMAIGWAQRSIEDVLAGQLLQSGSIRMIYEDGQLCSVPLGSATSVDCYCGKYGAGDHGL